MLQAHPLLRSTLAALAFMMLAAAPLSAQADSDDQDRARKAMLAGKVRPLIELIVHVESMYEGEIIEVELEEDDDGAWFGANGEAMMLYEIKLLTPQGNLVKLEFNAESLELLTVDGHDSDSALKDTSDDDD